MAKDNKEALLPWTWNDAWVLMAIYCAGGEKGAELRGIISAGDWINHAIFSYEELKEGTEKLIAIGFLTIKEDVFHLTPKFTKGYKELGKHPRAILAATTQMEGWLRQLPCEAMSVVSVSEAALSKELIAAAYAAYMQS